MPILISDELAQAALRTAVKAGVPSVVEGLIKSGVNVSESAALVYAEFFGHSEVSEIIRKAIQDEKLTAHKARFHEPSP